MPKTTSRQTTAFRVIAKGETLRDVTIDVTNGTAVTVLGAGTFRLERCVIKGKIGILIRGKARVEAVDSWIEGTSWGATVFGMGKLSIVRGVIKGPGGRTYGSKGAVTLFRNGELSLRDSRVWGFVVPMGSSRVIGH